MMILLKHFDGFDFQDWEIWRKKQMKSEAVKANGGTQSHMLMTEQNRSDCH